MLPFTDPLKLITIDRFMVNNPGMQPLDVAFYRSLKTYYDQACDRFMVNNPGKVITDRKIRHIFGEAYLKAATLEITINGFQRIGIEPYNPDIFSDIDFVPACVSERPLSAGRTETEDADWNSSDDEPLINLQIKFLQLI
ncbi:hypothetical protein QE152_g28326 [Popillia japonica]|uniref:Uncharacterized protein n=1 Tax=Popillia japonica TaxID=7064 RepID=A0AAW1JL65_POPJA